MIDTALLHLADFEQWLKNMRLNVDSKQSTRIFSNSVWLRDHVETQLKRRLEPMRKELTELKEAATDSTVENNLSMSIKHCDEVIKHLTALYQAHKQPLSESLARQHWMQALPGLFAATTHLRNRLTITQGLFRTTRDKEKHHWLNEL